MATTTNNNNNIYSINQQVDGLKDIMRDNVNKVMERDISLRDLENRTQDLEDHANIFQTNTTRVKRFFACQNRKWTIIIIVTILVILLIIGLAIGLSVSSKQK